VGVLSISPVAVDAGKNTSHTFPVWPLTVGNGTHNTTYTLEELMHMPFVSLNGSSPGGTPEVGYWGGVLVRDLAAPYVDGAWEYEVEFTASDGFSKNLTHAMSTANDTILAFWKDSDWLNITANGYLRVATLGASGTGWAWPKNVTYLQVFRTNTTATERDWQIEIDAYVDAVLDWDEFIHKGHRGVHFGSRGSAMSEPGYYIGSSMKDFLAGYVGPWTRYTVTVVASDGFNRTADEDRAYNSTWLLTYGVNGSQFTDLSDTGWVRMFSLNDTSAQAGQYSIKNVSKIIVTPLEAGGLDFQWNLTLKDENGTVMAFYDPLNFTTLDYLEGPMYAWSGDGVYEKGIFVFKGVNFTALMEQYMTVGAGVNISTEAFDGYTGSMTWADDVVSNATHTTILAFSMDGGDLDRTDGNAAKTLFFGLVSADATDIPNMNGATYGVGTLTFTGEAAPPPTTTPTPTPTEPPPPIDMTLLLLIGGGVGAVVVIVILVYVFRRK
jgi:hypothetical protein